MHSKNQVNDNQPTIPWLLSFTTAAPDVSGTINNRHRPNQEQKDNPCFASYRGQRKIIAPPGNTSKRTIRNGVQHAIAIELRPEVKSLVTVSARLLWPYNRTDGADDCAMTIVRKKIVGLFFYFVVQNQTEKQGKHEHKMSLLRVMRLS